jgi:hypothetical protein
MSGVRVARTKVARVNIAVASVGKLVTVSRNGAIAAAMTSQLVPALEVSGPVTTEPASIVAPATSRRSTRPHQQSPRRQEIRLYLRWMAQQPKLARPTCRLAPAIALTSASVGARAGTVAMIAVLGHHRQLPEKADLAAMIVHAGRETVAAGTVREMAAEVSAVGMTVAPAVVADVRLSVTRPDRVRTAGLIPRRHLPRWARCSTRVTATRRADSSFCVCLMNGDLRVRCRSARSVNSVKWDS